MPEVPIPAPDLATHPRTAVPAAPLAGIPLRWIRCRPLLDAPATASAADAPDPAIPSLLDALVAHGLLPAGQAPCRLSLVAPPCRWQLRAPDLSLPVPSGLDPAARLVGVWRCRLRLSVAAVAFPALPGDAPLETEPSAWEALICHPLPPAAAIPLPPTERLELLVAGLSSLDADAVPELGLPSGRSRLLDPRQLRGQLLEFLKFRVLAAQEAFFTSFRDPSDASFSADATADAPASIAGFRAWLAPHWPDAVHLSDEDLRHCLEQAHRLYVN